MSDIHQLLSALHEQTIARQVGLPHDEARMRYPLSSNTVGDFDEFTQRIGDYYNYHFTSCVSGGGRLSRTESAGRAKELLDREYRRQHGDLMTAYHDAADGTHGGLRVVLDRIAEALKAESVERYVRDTFDRCVAPNDWDRKVRIIREFIDCCGVNLGSAIRSDQPERYAQNFQDLIRSYVRALQQTSSVFRNL